MEGIEHVEEALQENIANTEQTTTSNGMIESSYMYDLARMVISW